MASQSVYKVIFQNGNQVFEVFARQIYQSDMWGFVEIEELVLGGRERADLVEARDRSEVAAMPEGPQLAVVATGPDRDPVEAALALGVEEQRLEHAIDELGPPPQELVEGADRAGDAAAPPDLGLAQAQQPDDVGEIAVEGDLLVGPVLAHARLALAQIETCIFTGLLWVTAQVQLVIHQLEGHAEVQAYIT